MIIFVEAVAHSLPIGMSAVGHPGNDSSHQPPARGNYFWPRGPSLPSFKGGDNIRIFKAFTEFPALVYTPDGYIARAASQCVSKNVTSAQKAYIQDMVCILFVLFQVMN